MKSHIRRHRSVDINKWILRDAFFDKLVNTETDILINHL